MKIKKKFLKQVHKAVKKRDQGFILTNLSKTHAADLSVLFDSLDMEESQFIFGLLPAATRADLITYLDEDVRDVFIEGCSPAEMTAMVEYMDSDDAVDILQGQPLQLREEVIASLDNREKAKHIISLLHYEADCAGGLMAKELIKANINWSVGHCIDEIRRQAEFVDKIFTIYVVDDDEILLGRISTKKLLISPDSALIKGLYDPNIERVFTYASDQEVVETMQHYDLESLPVTNVHGRLLGRITIDDVVDVMREKSEQDMQMMSGISSDIEENDTIWALSKARLPWLLIGIAGGMLGAQFLGLFEKDLALVPAMAFFIPLITATGGNVGIQSSTLVVQTLANSSLFLQSAWQRFVKGLLVALINGLVIGLAVFVINFFLLDTLELALVVSAALFAVVLLASFMGTVTPLALNRLGINPAVASGPFITTANDLLGLAVYFLIARVLLAAL